MRRREFVSLVGCAAVWPLAVDAQQSGGRVYKIGYLQIAAREQTVHLIKGLEDGLRTLGYRVGENVLFGYRFANGEMDPLPALAADLVRAGVDIIVTGNNANGDFHSGRTRRSPTIAQEHSAEAIELLVEIMRDADR